MIKFWSVTKKCDETTKLRNYENTDGTSDIGDYVNSILDKKLKLDEILKTHLGPSNTKELDI